MEFQPPAPLPSILPPRPSPHQIDGAAGGARGRGRFDLMHNDLLEVFNMRRKNHPIEFIKIRPDEQDLQ